VIPFRLTSRFTDLSPEEVTDLYTTVQKVQRMLAAVYFQSPAPNPTDGPTIPPSSPSKSLLSKDILAKGSFNLAQQDGVHSGQTVPHVHVHILPRVDGNTEADGIYRRLLSEQGNVGGKLWDAWVERRPEMKGQAPIVDEASRKNRTPEELSKEASVFAQWMTVLDELERD
jgi:bis(5'-adenosyl)-triphosphatase